MAATRTLETLVEAYPRDVRALAAAARQLICEVLPGVEERVDPKQALVAYGYGPGYKGHGLHAPPREVWREARYR